MSTVRLLLKPADVLMFRDTRPFDQVTTATASQFPTPRVAAGAIRTWLLRGLGMDLDAFRRSMRQNGGHATTRELLEASCPDEARWVLDAEICGPWVAEDSTKDPLYPPPMHLVKMQGSSTAQKIQDSSTDDWRLGSLRPLKAPFPGYRPPDNGPESFRPCWTKESIQWEGLEAGFRIDEDNAGALLDKDNAEALLRQDIKSTSNIVQMNPDTGQPDDIYWRDETRFGIGINPEQLSVEEGALYASSFMRLGDDYSFVVDVKAERVALQDTISALQAKQPWLRFGGEGRVVSVSNVIDCEQPVPASPVPWSDAQRFFTWLITPGLFQDGGWFPRNLAQRHRLVGAITGEPFAVPGWDVASNRPLPTRYAVQAGAVFFWERESEDAFDPHANCISDDEDDQQAGWGLCLRGEWDYED